MLDQDIPERARGASDYPGPGAWKGAILIEGIFPAVYTRE
jgi:hypothetical protein